MNVQNSARRLHRVLSRTQGKTCWHVSVGGSTLPQFTLALGEKIKRKEFIPNHALSHAFREFEGEISFFIRCWWRLENAESIVISSNGDEKEIVGGLNNLIGKSLLRVKIGKPAWDLVLEFSKGWVLRVFSDQPDEANGYLRNWHARVKGTKVYVGPGVKFEIVKGADICHKSTWSV